VRALYAVERQCKDASVEERLKLRQQQSAPLLAQLRERLLTWKAQLLPRDEAGRPQSQLCPVLDYAQSSAERRESRHFHWLMGDLLH
jgi:Transposase IS66 family